MIRYSTGATAPGSSELTFLSDINGVLDTAAEAICARRTRRRTNLLAEYRIIYSYSVVPLILAVTLSFPFLCNSRGKGRGRLNIREVDRLRILLFCERPSSFHPAMFWTLGLQRSTSSKLTIDLGQRFHSYQANGALSLRPCSPKEFFLTLRRRSCATTRNQRIKGLCLLSSGVSGHQPFNSVS